MLANGKHFTKITVYLVAIIYEQTKTANIDFNYTPWH